MHNFVRPKSYILKNKKILLIHILPLSLAVVIGIIVTLIVGQDQNWDLLNYHFYNPYIFLHGLENKNIAPAQIQTYINPLLDIPSYVLITSLKPIIAGSILGAIQGLNLWFIYEISLVILFSIFRSQTYKTYLFAFTIAVVSFFGAVNLGEIGGTNADNIISLPILLSLFLLLLLVSKTNNWVNNNTSLVRFIAYGIAGFAIGLKLTVAPFAVALLLVETVHYVNFKKFIKSLLVNISSLCAGFIASYGYWAYFLYEHFKNPFFPYFNKIFHSSYYPIRNYYGNQYYPHGIFQTIFFPLYFVYRDPRLGILCILMFYLALILCLSHFVKAIPKPKINREITALLLFILGGYILWLRIFSVYRYIVILEFLSFVAIVATLKIIVQSSKLTIFVASVMIIPLLLLTVPMHYGRIPWQASWFGVKIPTNYITKDSTVLMTGIQAESFLIPFFPDSVNFVRTQGDVYGGELPFPETTAYKSLASSDILKEKQRGSAFFAIETSDQADLAPVQIKKYGLKIVSCRPIYTYVSHYLYKNNNFYELCKLK